MKKRKVFTCGDCGYETSGSENARFARWNAFRELISSPATGFVPRDGKRTGTKRGRFEASLRIKPASRVDRVLGGGLFGILLLWAVNREWEVNSFTANCRRVAK